jgi:hypothetical protein
MHKCTIKRKVNAWCELLLVCVKRTPQEAPEQHKLFNSQGLQGHLLLLLDCHLLLFTQLSLCQGRVAMPMLQPWDVRPMHQHSCGPQSGHPN